jgi:hypothetical protein
VIVAQRHRVDTLFAQGGDRSSRIACQAERFAPSKTGTEIGSQRRFNVGERDVAIAKKGAIAAKL